MCVGLPAEVLAVFDGVAQVRLGEDARQVSTLLLERAPVVGEHVLIHRDSAIRLIDPEEAALVADALQAVLAAADGEAFEHLIADLVDREPELPAHLRPQGP